MCENLVHIYVSEFCQNQEHTQVYDVQKCLMTENRLNEIYYVSDDNTTRLLSNHIDIQNRDISEKCFKCQLLLSSSSVNSDNINV